MKAKVIKAVLFLFIVVVVLFSVILRVGTQKLYGVFDFPLLYGFFDLPSLIFIILGISFTGLNFRLKDIFTVLLYPINKDKISLKPKYYNVVLRNVNRNIFRFALLAFVLGVYFCFSRIESTWNLISGIFCGTIPLFYAFVIMIFIVKPIETAIKQMENKGEHNFE